MRLEILEHGHTPIQKLLLRLVRLYLPTVPGPILTLSYRRELFGKHFARVLHGVMRSRTSLAKSETELIAAFVADRNRCRY